MSQAVFTVAMLQMLPPGSGDDDAITKGDEWCRRAAECGADLALFPEMWSVGYEIPDPRDMAAVDAWAGRAVSVDGEYVRHFQRLARDLDMAIAVTYLERWPGRPRNSLSVIDRRGELLMTYAKVHTCKWDKECLLTPGNEFVVAGLDTASAGFVPVGAMICYDREHPESARILMLKGAEIILTANACELEENRLAQFRTRAYENMVGLAMANYPAPKENGHSIAFDGIAFSRDESSRDHKIAEGGEGEEIVLAQFDLSALRAYRESEVWGNAFRRADVYADLVDPDPKPPFARARGRAGQPVAKGTSTHQVSEGRGSSREVYGFPDTCKLR